MGMTKEEARDYIIRHCNPDYPKGKTEWETALNMAIDALSADGDCISRQAAKLKVARVTWEDGDSCGDFHDKCVDCLDDLPSAQPEQEKYEYHYDHTDCIWYRPEARNRCPTTCAQYRDGWNDAMNYIFRDGKGYRPYRRDKQYGE